MHTSFVHFLYFQTVFISISIAIQTIFFLMLTIQVGHSLNILGNPSNNEGGYQNISRQLLNPPSPQIPPAPPHIHAHTVYLHIYYNSYPSNKINIFPGVTIIIHITIQSLAKAHNQPTSKTLNKKQCASLFTDT